MAEMRTARVERNTKETRIAIEVNLDGTGVYDISTGVGFLDHMLEQLSRHSLIDIMVKAEGDTHIDFHHTTEDTALALGSAISDALGDRAGIGRYGSALIPMDETLTRVVLDASNRPYLIWEVDFPIPKVGDMDTELFKEWFQALSPRQSDNVVHVQCKACLYHSDDLPVSCLSLPEHAGQSIYYRPPCEKPGFSFFLRKLLKGSCLYHLIAVLHRAALFP